MFADVRRSIKISLPTLIVVLQLADCVIFIVTTQDLVLKTELNCPTNLEYTKHSANDYDVFAYSAKS